MPDRSTLEAAALAPASPNERRADLDAIRAFAMLLGIALHAALSYAPVPWLATDSRTSPALLAFVEIVHGFRMPLFFLMSGFFGAMLIRRRGVGGFVRHRWQRIGIPLLLGMVTIVPATWAVIVGGHVVKAVVPAPERAPGSDAGDAATIWSAAAAGELEDVRRLVESGVPVNEPDPRVFTLPLAWAATGDHADVVAFLLASGADPNRRMGDENAPLHTACFFGASESVALLLDAGADPGARNVHGETPIDSMRHEQGVVDFIANLLAVEADYDAVRAGRDEIRRLLAERPDVTVASEAPSPLARAASVVLGAEVFMHLWFLWHLLWLGAGLAVLALIARALRLPRVPAPLVATPLCLLVLIPLTALTQSWQANFGPDTSATLVPAPHVLAHEAVFFGFGALLFATTGAVDRIGRAWWAHLSVAAIACVLGLQLTRDPAAFADHGIDASTGRIAGVLLQSIFVWTISFGLIGVARRLLARPSARIRSVSDSSYWLYLAHLPLVIAGQFALAYVEFPPLVEFAVLTIGSTIVLLASYYWLVRGTWIGRMLNGPRGGPGGRSTPATAPRAKVTPAAA